MAGRIDNLLLKIAGWLIRIAAFFGIDRWNLIVIWIFVSFQALNFAPELKDFTKSAIFGIFIGFMALFPASHCYREGNILSNNPLIVNRGYRLFQFLVFWTMSLLLLLLPHQLFVVNILRIAMPVYLWPWFCLNQSPKDPLTLRSLVKSMIKKILSPSPKPVPDTASNFNPPT